LIHNKSNHSYPAIKIVMNFYSPQDKQAAEIPLRTGAIVTATIANGIWANHCVSL